MQQVADVVSGKKNQNCCQKGRKTDVEKTAWRWEAKEKHSSQKIEAKQPVTHRQFYYYCQLILKDLNNFRNQPFVSVSGSPGLKVLVVDVVLSSHERKIYPITFLDENSIEFEFQTDRDRNVYVELRQTFLALKIKLVKGRCFDTYKTTKKKKEHKEVTVYTKRGDNDVEFIEEDKGVPHITHVNNILHSIFCNAELYISNHQIYKSNGLYVHKSHISNSMTMKKIQRICSKVHFSLEE